MGADRSYAFGLAVEAPFELGLAALKGSARPAGRVLLEPADPDEIGRRWPDGDTALVMERRQPSGHRYLSVERHGTAGYRVHAPDYGSYLMSGDGRRVLASIPVEAGWQWKRLLFAQVLPMAAALQGLAAFHAGAVAMEGSVFGFVAPSGTGKTSLTARLVSLGAKFVTDDVLALSEGGGRVLGHPGAPMLALHPDEVAALDASRQVRLGREVGTQGKTYFAPPVPETAAPLAGLFYLRRHPSISSFELERVPADPGVLLSGAFLAHLAAPEHLQGHLDVCALIARTVPVYRVSVPFDHGSGAVAEEVLALISSGDVSAA